MIKNKTKSNLEIIAFSLFILGPIVTVFQMDKLAQYLCYTSDLKGSSVCIPNTFLAIIILIAPFLVTGIILLLIARIKRK